MRRRFDIQPTEDLSVFAAVCGTPGLSADTVAAHLAIRLEEKQVLLEMGSARRRMEHLMALGEGFGRHLVPGAK